MAPVLDRTDPALVGRLCSERKFEHLGYSLGDSALDTSDGASLGDYFRLRDIWFGADTFDSVRLAQALLEICRGIGRCAVVEQQYRSLTTGFEHALARRADQQAVGAGE
jgi:hypothetical protein